MDSRHHGVTASRHPRLHRASLREPCPIFISSRRRAAMRNCQVNQSLALRIVGHGPERPQLFVQLTTMTRHDRTRDGQLLVNVQSAAAARNNIHRWPSSRTRDERGCSSDQILICALPAPSVRHPTVPGNTSGPSLKRSLGASFAVRPSAPADPAIEPTPAAPFSSDT
jgi:hypothetical protein